LEQTPEQINDTKRKATVDRWVDDFGDALYAKAFHMTYSKEVAQDIVQETFLAAFTSFEQCKNKEQPKSWLFSILHNKAMDHFRDTAKRPVPVDLDAERQVEGLFNDNGRWKNTSSGQEEPDLLDIPEFNMVMANCIEKLPVTWKNAILSKYVFGKKGTEICQELDISPSLYWQAVHRAKLSLKTCIEQNWTQNE
jgi:RNA polymerase sigma-70 factor (ECF subfamily)